MTGCFKIFNNTADSVVNVTESRHIYAMSFMTYTLQHRVQIVELFYVD